VILFHNQQPADQAKPAHKNAATIQRKFKMRQVNILLTPFFIQLYIRIGQ
jgi:hypothetical protein